MDYALSLVLFASFSPLFCLCQWKFWTIFTLLPLHIHMWSQKHQKKNEILFLFFALVVVCVDVVILPVCCSLRFVSFRRAMRSLVLFLLVERFTRLPQTRLKTLKHASVQLLFALTKRRRLRRRQQTQTEANDRWWKCKNETTRITFHAYNARWLWPLSLNVLAFLFVWSRKRRILFSFFCLFFLFLCRCCWFPLHVCRSGIETSARIQIML